MRGVHNLAVVVTARLSLRKRFERGADEQCAPLSSSLVRKAVLVDVDGTLCDVSGIRHYVQSVPKTRNFDKFHRASALCPAIPNTV